MGRRPVMPGGGIALLICLVLAAGSIVPGPPGGPAARAVVPEPSGTEAQIRVGDLRAGAQEISGLDGAIFGLFAAPQTGSIRDDTDGYVHVPGLPPGELLFQCRSDADGDCSFPVPVRSGSPEACQAVPTDPRTGPVTCDTGANPGVPQGTRLWAAPLTYADEPRADGWDFYANPWWQTAPLANTNRVSIRHTFQTPGLVAGRTYLAGRDWITSPGRPPPGPGYRRRTVVPACCRSRVPVRCRCSC